LRMPSLTSCPMRCQDGAFDRRGALERMGLTDPSHPTPSELMNACSRPYSVNNELKGRDEDPRSFPTLAPGLTIVAQCDNTTCPSHKQDQLFPIGQGEHDLLLDAECYNCRCCGGPGDATTLLFRNCPIQMTVCERFQGGRKNLYSVKESAFGKIMSYELSGNYVKLEVSTTTLPSAPGLSFRPIRAPVCSRQPQGLTVNLQCLQCGGKDCVPLGIGRHDGASWSQQSLCRFDRCEQQMVPTGLVFHGVWHASVKILDGSTVKFGEHTERGRNISLELDLPDGCRIIEVHSASA